MTLASELEQNRKSAKRDAELKSLRRHVELLENAVREARNVQVKPPPKRPKAAAKGSFKRVIVPDSHGYAIDCGARDAFLADLEHIRPAEIVMLGDHLDCGGWLAQHHTLGYVSETGYSYEQDLRAANDFLNQIQERAPSARMWYIEGNHEQRVAKWVIDQTLGSPTDCAFLMRVFGPRYQLGIEQRGIRWVDRGAHYDGLQRKGCIRLGKCIFTHGDRATGVNAAQTMLRQFGANVCFGHTHRLAVATKESADEPTLGAWSFGCLCQRVPFYANTNPTDWAHGYGLQIVEPSGRFFTIQVPIIDGRSLLQKLDLRAAA